MTGAKPFDISKREVWQVFKRVKANRGAAGVDGQSIVIAVKEPAFLVTMEWIFGSVQVQPDLPWWLLVGLDKNIHQQPIQCRRVRCDLLVAEPGR